MHSFDFAKHSEHSEWLNLLSSLKAFTNSKRKFTNLKASINGEIQILQDKA